MTTDQFECRGCRQWFDGKGLLHTHLRDNASHRRAPASRKHTKSLSLPVSQPKPCTPSNNAPATDTVGVSTGSTNIAIPWFQVTTEQSSYLRLVLLDECHSSEILKSSQYHIRNRTIAELELPQRCCNCGSKKLSRHVESVV